MDKEPAPLFDETFRRDMSRIARRMGVAVSTLLVSYGVSQCTSEDIPAPQQTITHEVQGGETVSGIVVEEVCPTFSPKEVQDAVREIGMLNNPSNPVNPSIAVGQSIEIPADLYCETE